MCQQSHISVKCSCFRGTLKMKVKMQQLIAMCNRPVFQGRQQSTSQTKRPCLVIIWGVNYILHHVQLSSSQSPFQKNKVFKYLWVRWGFKKISR